jgi:hypothetical protein
VDLTFLRVNYDQLLADYTARELTVGSDKLKAFEALGKLVAGRNGGQSVGGVWTDTLAKGLFWCSAGEALRRPEPLRAPSWSWASVDGRVEGTEPRMKESTWDDSDFIASKGGAGDLSVPKFVDRNPALQSQRGVSPLSLRVDALALQCSHSQDHASAFPQTMQQLRADIRLWPATYAPWPEDRCHLLFGEKSRTSRARTSNSTSTHCCPSCKAEIGSWDDSDAIRHMEKCKGDSASRDGPTPTSSRTKLLGVAYFDCPANPPLHFLAISLWHEGSQYIDVIKNLGTGVVFDAKASRKTTDARLANNSGPETRTRRDPYYPYSHLIKSPANILGVATDVSREWSEEWPPMHVRTKHTYFLLLVEETEFCRLL